MDSILRPAMTTSNEIVTDIYNNVLAIPLEALHSDSLSFVYAKKNGKLVKQEVITGVSNNDEVMIDHGLQEGDVYWLSMPENADDLSFSAIDASIKEQIKRKQIAEREERQAKMQERLKNVKDDEITSESSGGGGFIIIN